MRVLYLGHLAAKHWVKINTPLGRLVIRTQAWAQQPRPGERLQVPAGQPAVATQLER
jgi:hypothetical protein